MSLPDPNKISTAQRGPVIEFLKRTLPFSELPEQVLERLLLDLEVDFFPKGTTLFRQDETEVTHLLIIQKGGVKLFLKDESGEITLKDFRSEGGYVGALPIIQGTRANFTVETVEDTFVFRLPKERFLELIDSHPRFAQFFLRSFSEKYLLRAYRQLRQKRVEARPDSALYLFSVKVEEIIKRAPEVINSGDTIQYAAERMAELHIGSLLVRDPSGAIAGIVTDKDLRNKVVATGLGVGEPVAKIMSAPVETIPAHTVAFDALLTMMRRQIHHLAVERGGEIIGVITTHDIMVLQGTSPLYIFREIVAQRSIQGLYPISQKVPNVIHTLIDEGARSNNITRLITILNDHILQRLLTLMEEEMGPPPLPYCWMLMGSEGRKEQTFRTDQDNALIYQDPPDPKAAQEAQDYFRSLGETAIEHLVRCGFPRCPGEIMASNPKWCQPYSRWEAYFRDWITTPEPKEVLHATIFFDFRPGYGELALGERLRDYLSQECPSQHIFLYHLARDTLESKPPLSFFKNFIVEKDGEHRNRLDLKRRGLVPFVDFARLLALKNGLRETNTVERLQALENVGAISHELYTETREAYEFQMQLRLVHQMRMIEEGKEPDNYINPADLTDLEKQALKEAFSVIGRLQAVVREMIPMAG